MFSSVVYGSFSENVAINARGQLSTYNIQYDIAVNRNSLVNVFSEMKSILIGPDPISDGPKAVFKTLILSFNIEKTRCNINFCMVYDKYKVRKLLFYYLDTSVDLSISLCPWCYQCTNMT
jgi:hypothetical protein